MNSETVFQTQLNTVHAAIEASKHLGLDVTVFHNGLEVTELMPDAAELGGLAFHKCKGELVVTECTPTCVSVITEAQIRAAIVALVTAAVPGGRVWDMFKIPTNDAEMKSFWAERVKPNYYNAWIVRRVGFTNDRGGGIDRDLVSVTHTYELAYFRAHDK